ncbi:hypothetical protein TrCOL_g9978 [Triparma columacea]|uniref:HTH myb-type domain-containing protein n=1 Tax=Triparma columacea TaxID=722753 RepID=A0A9W7GRP6_9STRA|nr:hypothetical protein TrCOL_g9978 [Triparma columacea]
MEGRAGSRSGRWTFAEQVVFLQGLRTYGKGNWKQIGRDIPTRSLIQIKSHAQKVLKKIDAGEDLYRMLDNLDPSVDYTEAILNEEYENQTTHKKKKTFKVTRKKASYSAPPVLQTHPQHHFPPHYLSYPLAPHGNLYESTNSHHSGSEDEDAAHALSYLHQSPCEGPQAATTDRIPPLALDDQTHGDSSCGSSVSSHASNAIHQAASNPLLPPPYPSNALHQQQIQMQQQIQLQQRQQQILVQQHQQMQTLQQQQQVQAMQQRYQQPQYKYPNNPAQAARPTAKVSEDFTPHMEPDASGVKGAGGGAASDKERMGDAEILLSLFTSNVGVKKLGETEDVTRGGVKRMRSPLLEENGQNRKASPPESPRGGIGEARSPMIKT